MLVVVEDNKTEAVSICGLDWGDVLFINALLIKESSLSKSPTIQKRAEDLLLGFEAAAESIFKSTDLEAHHE